MESSIVNSYEQKEVMIKVITLAGTLQRNPIN